MRCSFSAFRTRVKGAWLISVGRVQPSTLSAAYKIEIRYKVGERPEVRVLEPRLTCREGEDRIPHMYDQECLCLYFPPANEWSGERSLGHSILPWVSLWLYYYELWHATGEWLGGGHEPVPRKPLRN